MAPGVLRSGSPSSSSPSSSRTSLADYANETGASTPLSDVSSSGALEDVASTKALESAASGGLDASLLTISKAKELKKLPEVDDLVFGRHMTDHMLTIPFSTTSGWAAPAIIPYQPLSLDPAACVLHYGFECFEGMKAFRDAKGNVRLFRPQENLERFKKSAERIGLPGFEVDQLAVLLKRFVDLERRWVYDHPCSLYLRPVLIGTSATLGVTAPTSALLYIIACPAGSYFSAPKPNPSTPTSQPSLSPPTSLSNPNTKSFHSPHPPAISLAAISSKTAIRAWPGGAGNCKVGGNYAPTIVLEKEVKSRGVSQVLWLLGDGEGEEFITEAGTMNVFVVLRRDPESDGGDSGEFDYEYEIVTPPLHTGTILPGVVRSSVLALARTRLAPLGYKVSERQIGMREFMRCYKEGRVLEVFGTGTASSVVSVGRIECEGVEGVERGKGEVRLETGKCGMRVARAMREWIERIQWGVDEGGEGMGMGMGWSVVVEEGMGVGV